jgi:two-component system, chemotaxis family, protein-glutamate methylesterase/glutaminase
VAVPQPVPARRDVILIGASAGGVEALTRLVCRLPHDLPAAVLVVLHLPAQGPSALPQILSRAGSLPARHPVDGEQLEYGTIFVGPPDRHLELTDESVRLSTGPRENGYRPAIDRLFTTAAAAFGPRVIGVILSGSLDDGTRGLATIAAVGGATLIQDPADALYPSMPESAAAHVPLAEVLTVEHLAGRMCELVDETVQPAVTEAVLTEQAPNPLSLAEAQPGPVSGLTCPDCGGALWEVDENGVPSFRCRIGHAYTPESLAAMQEESLEYALWGAVRALDERAALSNRLARRLGGNGNVTGARRYAERAKESAEQAAIVRAALSTIAPADDDRRA